MDEAYGKYPMIVVHDFIINLHRVFSRYPAGDERIHRFPAIFRFPYKKMLFYFPANSVGSSFSSKPYDGNSVTGCICVVTEPGCELIFLDYSRLGRSETDSQKEQEQQFFR